MLARANETDGPGHSKSERGQFLLFVSWENGNGRNDFFLFPRLKFMTTKVILYGRSVKLNFKINSLVSSEKMI